MQPVLVLLRRHCDVRRLGQLCQMGLPDLTKATGVRLPVLYAMQMGLSVKQTEVLRVMWVLSQRTGLASRL